GGRAAGAHRAGGDRAWCAGRGGRGAPRGSPRPGSARRHPAPPPPAPPRGASTSPAGPPFWIEVRAGERRGLHRAQLLLRPVPVAVAAAERGEVGPGLLVARVGVDGLAVGGAGGHRLPPGAQGPPRGGLGGATG